MPKLVTLSEFLSRSRKHHGDKYDYSHVKLGKIKDKVDIVCPEHGLFSQIAQHHSNGVGCKECGFAKVSRSKSMTIDEFMEKAVAVHGEKFTYSFGDNFMFTGRVGITCPDHGYFERTVKCHLQGEGCAVCSGRRSTNNLSLSAREFADMATSVHGDRYDYSGSVFIGTKNKVEILCKLHGYFTQNADDHLRGHGCKQCAFIVSNRTKKINDSIVGYSRGKYVAAADRNTKGKSFLYVVKMQSVDESFIKIGISIYGAAHRLKKVAHYTVSDILEISMPAGEAWDAEKVLHHKLKDLSYVTKEKFYGHTECFSGITGEAQSIIEELRRIYGQ